MASGTETGERGVTDRRSFTERRRVAIFLRQSGRCAICKLKLNPGAYEIDHIAALCHDGTNDDDNLRAVHPKCHANKSAADVRALHKIDRIIAGGTKRKGNPMPGTKASGLRKRMNGRVERW